MFPKVEKPETATENENNEIANNLRVLANMSSISEEVIEDLLEKSPARKANASASSAKVVKDNKLRPKLPVFKKRTTSTTESDKEAVEKTKSNDSSKKQVKKRTKEPEKDLHSAPIEGPNGIEMTRLPKAATATSAADKRREKSVRSVPDGKDQVQQQAGPAVTAPAVLNGISSAAMSSEIESMEQIEALIQMKMLPAETVTIHSPESGTTLF